MCQVKGPSDYFFPPPNFIDDSLLFIVLLAKLNFDFTEAAVLAAKRNDNVQRKFHLSMLPVTHAVVFLFLQRAPETMLTLSA